MPAVSSCHMGCCTHLYSVSLPPVQSQGDTHDTPHAHPASCLQGLRLLIGKAAQEAAARGLCVTPVFSLYSYHGPVFRTMLRITRKASWPSQHLGFIGTCPLHNMVTTVPWTELSRAACNCCGLTPGGAPLTLAGPMWTG
jgi:tRNA (guanine26-N2/guanine27-N2)-dimethyltransferase